MYRGKMGWDRNSLDQRGTGTSLYLGKLVSKFFLNKELERGGERSVVGLGRVTKIFV